MSRNEAAPARSIWDPELVFGLPIARAPAAIAPMQRCLAGVVAVFPDGGAAMAPQGEPPAGNEAGRIITRTIPFPWNGSAIIIAVILRIRASGARPTNYSSAHPHSKS